MYIGVVHIHSDKLYYKTLSLNIFAKCKVYNNVRIYCYVFHTHVSAFHGMQMKFTVMLEYSDMMQWLRFVQFRPSDSTELLTASYFFLKINIFSIRKLNF